MIRHAIAAIAAIAALAIALPTAAPSAQKLTDEDIANVLRDATQKEIDRIDAILPAKRAIAPGAGICVAQFRWAEYMQAAFEQDREHMQAVPGCVELAKGTRIAVLDYPNQLTAKIRMLLPIAPDPTNEGLVFFTLPASIVNIDIIPPALLARPPAKKR